MKKQLLLAAFGITALSASAQTVITDTVIMGNGYANQVWYSLPDDEQGSNAKNNWDLGFRVQGMFDLDILVNHTGKTAAGALWVYPKSDIGGWATADTNGLSTWAPLYNSEIAWMGALGRYAAPPGAATADYGWGFYNRDGDHKIKGDSVYFIRTQAGNFKKLKIDLFTANVYTFTYANLDGSDETTSTISKATYPGKKYAYFDLETKAAVDREPTVDKWDMVFGQYSDLAGPTPYTVTGVLLNDTLEAAKAVVDPATRASYKTYTAHTFSRNINGLGYMWKTTAGVIKDSNVYFVRRNNGDIWKMNFTGWISGAGAGNGSAIFTKEKLPTSSIGGKTVSSTTLALSPNPIVNGQAVNVVYNFAHSVNTAIVNVYDMTGRVVLSQELEKTAGLHAQALNTNIASGVYIVSVVADNELTQQRLIVQ
jgi:hypothetical protein